MHLPINQTGLNISTAFLNLNSNWHKEKFQFEFKLYRKINQWNFFYTIKKIFSPTNSAPTPEEHNQYSLKHS